jgi:twitching motility protein PilU
MEMHALLKELVTRGGSDLYITTDSPPLIRAEGVTEPISEARLDAEQTRRLAFSLMNERERGIFEEEFELNLAVELPDSGRFRVNVHRQRDHIGIVARHVKTAIPSIEDLGLPDDFKEVVLKKRGLVLVTGATGSGKSTSLAAMLGHRNAMTHGHVVTVEDPIEFIHPNKKCIFTQREVGADTKSFQHALKNALRQAPDVILIGEIRDRETMEAAITFADTGHLCLGTLHSSNAYQTMHRVLNFFPGERHDDILLELSMNLRAIISQRLVRATDGRRVAAVEILRDTSFVRELIKSGEVDKIREGMQRGEAGGCRTFDRALLDLYISGTIDREEALSSADYPNDLRLKLQQAVVEQAPAAIEPEAIEPDQAKRPAPERPVEIGLVPRMRERPDVRAVMETARESARVNCA